MYAKPPIAAITWKNSIEHRLDKVLNEHYTI